MIAYNKTAYAVGFCALAGVGFFVFGACSP